MLLNPAIFVKSKDVSNILAIRVPHTNIYNAGNMRRITDIYVYIYIYSRIYASLAHSTAPETMDLFNLSNRTALITGATRGIGQQMAIALAEAGSDIILVQVYLHSSQLLLAWKTR